MSVCEYLWLMSACEYLWLMSVCEYLWLMSLCEYLRLMSVCVCLFECLWLVSTKFVWWVIICFSVWSSRPVKGNERKLGKKVIILKKVDL